MTELQDTIIAKSRDAGICAEGFKRLHDLDKEGLVDYYLSIPDWCLERNFPPLPILRDNFCDITEKGVYVDHTFHGEVLNDLQTYVFHNCKGTIKVGLNTDKAIAPMLYLANGCRLRIVGVGDVVPKEPTKVPIYTFGKNDVSARKNKYVNFTIYKNKLI